jgi:GTPase SAR1 family protein
LEHYKEISREILKTLGSLFPEERTDPGDFGARAATVLEKLQIENFHIVVMGQFKRGKTTFINCLLGDDVLPSSVIPLTSINTILRYGEKPEARVHFLDGRADYIHTSEIPTYVTEKENPENGLGVQWVEVFHPSAYLKEGVSLVDTPGTGSTYLHNDEVAYSYLAHADAVIFMISADPPISRTELDFLHDIRRFVHKIFFVQNKMDYLDERERAESLNFNQRVLRGALGGSDLRLFPISAKMALKAKLENDTELLLHSDINDFTTHLDEFLMWEKGLTLLESALGKLDKILAEEIAAKELAVKLVTEPLDTLQKKIELFNREMLSLRREWDEIGFLLEGDSKTLVQDCLDEDVAAFKRRMTPILLESFERFFDGIADLSGFALAEKAGAFVKTAITECFTDWRHEEEQRIAAEFRVVAGRFRKKANAISNRVLQIAGDLFDISLLTIEADLDLSDEGEFWFKLGDPPPDLFEMFWSVVSKSLPKRVSHRILRKRAREQLLVLFDRHCGRVRYDFFLRLQKSALILKDRVNELIGETLQSIESSIGQAIRLREQNGGDLRGELDQIERRRLDLTQARGRLAELRSSLQEQPATPTGNT